MAEKKKKDLTWQHALIFIALGLSAASAWKLFMPKKPQNNGNQVQQTNDALELAQYYQHLQSLPQVPLNQGNQIPVVATQPYYPDNFQRMPAVSSHYEDMARNEQLQNIPIQEQVGLNQMFPSQQPNPSRNTVNPYQVPGVPRQQSTHFDRIMIGGSAEDVAKPSLRPQQVSPHQSQYLSSVGYSRDPYASGSVI